MTGHACDELEGIWPLHNRRYLSVPSDHPLIA